MAPLGTNHRTPYLFIYTISLCPKRMCVCVCVCVSGMPGARCAIVPRDTIPSSGTWRVSGTGQSEAALTSTPWRMDGRMDGWMMISGQETVFLLNSS
jgi:hypothetical protein